MKLAIYSFLMACWLFSVQVLSQQLLPLAGPDGPAHSFGYAPGSFSLAEVHDVIRVGDRLIAATDVDILASNYPNRIGLHISDDDGLSWQRVTDLNDLIQAAPYIHRPFRKLIRAGSRIYALSGTHLKGMFCDGGWIVENLGNAVYYSDDSGDSWYPVDPEYTLLPECNHWPFSDIAADDDYLYIAYGASSLSLEGQQIYKLPHSLDAVVRHSVIGSRMLRSIDDGWLVSDGDGVLWQLDNNLQTVREVLSTNSGINDVAIDGEHWVVLSSQIYESFDGGYSFNLVSVDYSCTSYFVAQIIQQQLYVATDCGVIRRAALNQPFQPVPLWDFARSFSRGLHYDSERQQLYLGTTRLHRFDLSTGAMQIMTPQNGNFAHITDMMLHQDQLYVATKGSGIWRLAESGWQQISNGLHLRRGDIKLANRDLEVYRLGQLQLPDGALVLCAGTVLGLFCLNESALYWQDVSSTLLEVMPGTGFSYEGHNGYLSNVVDFKQLDSQRVLLVGYQNAFYVLNTDDFPAILAKERVPWQQHQLGQMYNYDRHRISKAQLLVAQDQLYRVAGSFAFLGDHAESRSSSFFTNGLVGHGDFSGYAFGKFYPAFTNLSTDFLNTTVQQVIEFDGGYVAAVYQAGVYFAEQLEGPWVVRNRLLNTLRVESLAVYQGNLYVGTNRGLYQWWPEAAEWRLLPETRDLNVTRLYALEQQLFIGTAKNGLWLLQPEPPSYHLQLHLAGEGAGKVVIGPWLHECETHCDYQISEHTALSLEALPATGSVFTGWLGGCEGEALSCQWSMSTDMEVTAVFGLLQYSFDWSQTGEGTVLSPLEQQTVSHGSQLLFILDAAEGYRPTARVTGTCPAGAWLSKTEYQTGAIVQPCQIGFRFVAQPRWRSKPLWWLGVANETLSPAQRSEQ